VYALVDETAVCVMTEHTEALQRLTFDGPLAAWQAIGLGCILAALAFWTLFGVPRKARRKLAPVLFGLRVVAIAIVVWMLLGPVRATIYRRFTPKSLAVVTDVSRSMDVVDPPDKEADLRWQTAVGAGSSGSLLSVSDRLVSAAAMARDQLEWLLQNAARTAQPDRVRIRLETAGRAASAAVRLSKTFGQSLDTEQASLGPELCSRGKDLASALAASGIDQIGTLVPRNASTPFALKRDALDRIEQWHRELVQSVRALGQLADRVANRLAENGGGAPPAAAGSEVRTRREKVDRLLKTDEQSWLAGREATTRIRRYSFDQQTVALGTDSATKSIDGSEGTSAAGGPATKSLQKRGSVTNLSSALGRINRDATDAGIQAVLLFTDGRHNDPAAEDPRAVAKSLGDIPVYVVPVGSSRTRRDLILHHVEAPRVVVEGDQLVVDAIVSAYDCAGEKCVVELSERNTVIDRQEIAIASARRDCRVRLTAKPKGLGRHDYSLAVGAVKGEALTTNNSAEFGLDVIDATLRILVADDAPRWEFRYLIRLFERDKRIQYQQVLFQPTASGPGENGTPAQLPHDVDGWSRYRLAILGDLSPAELDQESQRALKEYLVDRGGTVILIAGSEAMPQAFAGMPLADFLPVSTAEAQDPSQGFDLALSAEGRLNPAMQIADAPDATEQVWKEMSRQLPVYSLSSYCIPKPTAHTLINAVPASQGSSGKDEKAFLCWQTVGRGRIVYLSAPAVYQLRLKYGDRYHYRFWGQLIRWAVARDLSQGSKTVKLLTDRSRASVGENLQIMANLSDVGGRPVSNAEVRVQASTDGGAASLIELRPDPKIPGRYLAEISPTDEGTLSLSASGTDVTQLLASEGFSKPVTTTVVVDPKQSIEMEDTRSNVPLLKQIAGLTGGQTVPPAAVGQLVELTNLEPAVHEETVRQPLWDRWIFLWLFCGVLTIEWTLRKATGLP
jgi:hypothetical protein